MSTHYYGTTEENPQKAEFSLAYIDKHGRTILGRKPRKNEKAKKWTGIIPLDDDMILGRATFYESKMSQSTKRRLKDKGLRHKYMQTKKKKKQTRKRK